VSVAQIDTNAVLEVLRPVQDPELQKSLVELNMIRNVAVEGDRVSFTLVLTTPACPLREMIVEDCQKAVRALGASAVEVDVTAETPQQKGLPDRQGVEGVKNIVAISRGKGGVGKTTLTVNLATCLVKHHRKRVLVVDLDPQISATLSLMPPKTFAKLRKAQRTLKFLLQDAIKSNFKHDVGIQEIIQPYAGSLLGIDVLPGDIDLYNDFLVAETLYRKALRNPDRNFDRVWADFEAQLMSGILKPIIDDYDFIFLDCAPSYNLLTRSSLVASDFYLIPAKPEPLSYSGMQLLERQLTKLIETHKDDGYMKAQLNGIVFTMSKNLLSGR